MGTNATDTKLQINLDTRAGGRDAPHHVASSPRLRGAPLRSLPTSSPMSTPSVLQTTRSWGVREASCSPGTPTSSPLEPTGRPAGRPSDASRLAEGASGLSAGQPRRTAPVAERPDRQRRPEGPTLLTTPFMQPNVTRPIQHMWNLHSCCILLQPAAHLLHYFPSLSLPHTACYTRC